MTTVLPPVQLSGAARQAPVAKATPPAVPSQVTMAAALNRALADSLAADDRVVVFGEDVGTLDQVRWDLVDVGAVADERADAGARHQALAVHQHQGAL